jgi:hypothetical protein
MQTGYHNGIPVIAVNLMYGQGCCTTNDICVKYCAGFQKRMVGRYVGEQEPCKNQFVSALIFLNAFNYDEYISKVKKIHKSASFRQSKKADKQGYYCKQFAWRNHIPDIVEINQSKETRSGGKMRAAYQRSIEELGGPPKKEIKVASPKCPLHTTFCWGIFEHREGYSQGDIITNEKLLAYIKFKRIGNYSVYTSILGHGDYLRYGIMYRLHYAIMAWIGENKNGLLSGLDFLLYGAFDSGNEGLQQWKKRAVFEKAYLVLAAAE